VAVAFVLAGCTSVGDAQQVIDRARLVNDLASRLDHASAPDGGSIAVSIEETGAGARLDLFGRSHGLSAREQQLLRLLSRGADTQDIAEEMTISEYTVQDHLKSIFGKTSLTSRNAVLSAALGPGPTG